MKAVPNKSKNTYLIWLVSFALLFGMGDSVSASAFPLRHLRQTEVTFSASHQKITKQSHFSALFLAESDCFHALGTSFHLLINKHTRASELKQKTCCLHLISNSPKIGLAHNKSTLYGDDDPSILIG